MKKKKSDLRKELSEKMAELRRLRNESQTIANKTSRISQQITSIKNDIIEQESLLSGRWQFHSMDQDRVTFVSHAEDHPVFAALMETDCHGTYYEFEYAGERIDFRHDDGHLTIKFTLKQFTRVAREMADFGLGLSEVREEIAKAILQRNRLEEIEAFVESHGRTRPTKRVSKKK